MSKWHLVLKTTHGEYDIPIGPDEPEALRALQEAGQKIGMSGTVTIAERVVLDARTLHSASISLRSA